MKNYFQVIKRDSILSYSILAAIFLSLIIFIVYMPALHNGFVNWDDNVYVYENTNIHLSGLRFLKWSLTSRVIDLWHPAPFISFALDYATWGLNPKGYHLANILLHSLNTFLVYILSVRLILNCNARFHKKAIIAGFVTALLFGIHPLHVESVAWVSERKDVLCAFFFLLSLLSYLKYLSSKLSRYNYVLCLIFYILALMSKPMAISLPMVLLILDYYPLMRLKIGGNLKKVFIEKLPLFFLGALSVLITLWPKLSGIAGNMAPHPITERILVFVHGYVFYLQKMLFPTHLAPLYPYPLNVNFLEYNYIGSSAILFLISIVCVCSLKRSKLLFCIWLYYIISLLPVAGVIGTGTPHSMADRYTYLPSFGPFLLIGLGVETLVDKFLNWQRHAVIGVLIVLLLFMASKTKSQIGFWHDSIVLWSYEISLFSNSDIAYSHLGGAYIYLGKYELAIKNCSKAIELDPWNTEAYVYNNRGIGYYHLGNYQEAINDFSTAIKLQAGNADSYCNRGAVYFSLGNYQYAINDYNMAIELERKLIKGYKNRGLVYQALSRHQEAITDFDTTIELNPQDEVAYTYRGNSYYVLGNHRQAIIDYGRAIELNPEYVDAYNNRGYIYYINGDHEISARDLKKAIELDSKNAETYYNLGLLYLKMKNRELSRISFKKASELGLKKADDIVIK